MKISRYMMLALLSLLSSLLLTSCKEKQTYSYYMCHPQQLQQAITECQSSFQKTKEQAEQCEAVGYAAVNMNTLVNQLQADPEKFGQRVLDAQENYAKLTAKADEATKAVEGLQNNHASPTELRTAQDDLYKAKKACAD